MNTNITPPLLVTTKHGNLAGPTCSPEFLEQTPIWVTTLDTTPKDPQLHLRTITLNSSLMLPSLSNPSSLRPTCINLNSPSSPSTLFLTIKMLTGTDLNPNKRLLLTDMEADKSPSSRPTLPSPKTSRPVVLHSLIPLPAQILSISSPPVLMTLKPSLSMMMLTGSMNPLPRWTVLKIGTVQPNGGTLTSTPKPECIFYLANLTNAAFIRNFNIYIILFLRHIDVSFYLSM